MTSPFTGQGQMPGLPTPPTGWPIGSYATYAEAQRAVDHLADSEFPVQEVTIVGVDLMLVERVIRRLTWGRVLGTGAASGAWFGLFVGFLLSLFAEPEAGFLGPILVGLTTGVIFGMVFAAAGYASSVAGATSPRPVSWWPAATTCSASRATRRRPATCSRSSRWVPRRRSGQSCGASVGYDSDAD